MAQAASNRFFFAETAFAGQFCCKAAKSSTELRQRKVAVRKLPSQWTARAGLARRFAQLLRMVRAGDAQAP
ncbi:hypothetical protein [Brachymonas denitrificans]|uniref:hypothetical protein n=1 Tax=Brachymonas denitrificans TaxID=28220 RepID=UPI001BCA864D|nr:hypothetical protein [Brachymonas denitrificans]